MKSQVLPAVLLSGVAIALTVTVDPGDSLQDSLNLLSSGDTLYLSPGTYQSADDPPLLSITAEHAGVTVISDPYDRAVLNGNGSPGPVVETSGPLSAAVFLGNLVVTGGNATGGTWFCGGGIYCEESEVTISNCLITGNTALIGGGIGSEGSEIAAHFCTFHDNQSLVTGGGIDLYASDFLGFHLVFTNNQSSDDGGALNAYQSSVELVNGFFTGNSSGDDGGGATILQGTADLSFCTFNDNTAADDGGALRIHTVDSMTVRSTIITSNTGKGGVNVISETKPEFYNTCCWNNDFADYHGMPDPTGSMGNISADPLYANSILDLSQEAAGQPETSPAVDAGHCQTSGSAVDGFSTRTDSLPDLGTADMGFHHISSLQTGIRPAGRVIHQLSVSPSPAAPGMYLLLAGVPDNGAVITLHDLTGRTVHVFSEENRLPSDLPGGLFLVQASWSSGMATAKLAVLR